MESAPVSDLGLGAETKRCAPQLGRLGEFPVEKLPLIEVGYQVFVQDGATEFGAVRQVLPGGEPQIVVYVENAGDFLVPLSAVEAVHSGKVIVKTQKLDRRLRAAIGHAHDSEQPDT